MTGRRFISRGTLFRKGGERKFSGFGQLLQRGFQFAQQFVICPYLTIQLAAVSNHTLLFQIARMIPLMDSRLLAQSQCSMAQMCNPFGPLLLLQCAIDILCPAFPPFQKLHFTVPRLADGILPPEFGGFRLLGGALPCRMQSRFGGRKPAGNAAFIAVLIELFPTFRLCLPKLRCGEPFFFFSAAAEIFFLRLCLPFAIGIQWADGQHDMGVRIVTICIMDGEVGAHPFRNTFFQHKLVQHCLPVLHGQLRGQCNNQLAGKPTVFCFFGLLYRIPESLPICPFSRDHIGQQYFGKQNARFLRIIMGNTVIIVVKPFAALICCGGNSRAPSATADDFRFKVVDCRFYHLAFRTYSRPSSLVLRVLRPLL